MSGHGRGSERGLMHLGGEAPTWRQWELQAEGGRGGAESLPAGSGLSCSTNSKHLMPLRGAQPDRMTPVKGQIHAELSL